MERGREARVGREVVAVEDLRLELHGGEPGVAIEAVVLENCLLGGEEVDAFVFLAGEGEIEVVELEDVGRQASHGERAGGGDDGLRERFRLGLGRRGGRGRDEQQQAAGGRNIEGGLDARGRQFGPRGRAHGDGLPGVRLELAGEGVQLLNREAVSDQCGARGRVETGIHQEQKLAGVELAAQVEEVAAGRVVERHGGHARLCQLFGLGQALPTRGVLRSQLGHAV